MYTLGNTITADTVPDLDGGWFNSGWTIEQWIIWHEKRSSKYGVDRANEDWLYYFNQQSWYDATKFEDQYSCVAQKYFKKVGLPTDFTSLVLCNAADVVTTGAETVSDVATDVTGAASELSQGALSTTNVIKVAAPLLVLSVSIGTLYYGYKNYIKGDKRIKVKGVTV